jgi:hypothetical protein
VNTCRELRARSIKPLKVAARGCGGRGSYGNSMVGKSGVSVCEDRAVERDTRGCGPSSWLTRQSFSKSVVEQFAKSDWFSLKAHR